MVRMVGGGVGDTSSGEQGAGKEVFVALLVAPPAVAPPLSEPEAASL